MGKLARHSVLIVLSLAMAFPLVWMVLSSMKEHTAILASPLALPVSFEFEPFQRAWVEGRFGQHFANSLIVTGSAVFGVIILGSMAGFALARFKIPAAPVIAALFVIGLLLPIEGILIPLYRLVETLGIQRSLFALILPYIALELPIAVFLFRTYYLQIPKEIEESGRMDGCNAWQLYWRIFLPMGRQAMGVVGILAFLAIWNEFLLANFLVSDPENRTMPAAFNNFYGRHRVNYQLIFAGLSIYVLPAVVFYLVMSRAIARSVTAGALKG